MSYKRPESVLVVIYTPTTQVLLLQRNDLPSFWQSVTGSLQEGETPIQAAQREVWEETGLKVNNTLQDCHLQNRFAIVPPWKARYAPEVTHNIEHVFTLIVPDGCHIQLNHQEHLQYCWVSYAQAIQQVTSYTNRDAIIQFVDSNLTKYSKGTMR